MARFNPDTGERLDAEPQPTKPPPVAEQPKPEPRPAQPPAGKGK